MFTNWGFQRDDDAMDEVFTERPKRSDGPHTIQSRSKKLLRNRIASKKDADETVASLLQDVRRYQNEIKAQRAVLEEYKSSLEQIRDAQDYLPNVHNSNIETELNRRVQAGVQLFNDTVEFCHRSIECYLHLDRIFAQCIHFLELMLEVQHSLSHGYVDRDLRDRVQEVPLKVQELYMSVNGFNTKRERYGQVISNAMSKYAIAIKMVLDLLDQVPILYKDLFDNVRQRRAGRTLTLI